MRRYLCCAILTLAASGLPLLAAEKIVGGAQAGAKVETPDPAAAFAKRDLAEGILRDLAQTAGKELDPAYRAKTLDELLKLSADQLSRLAAGEKSKTIA